MKQNLVVGLGSVSDRRHVLVGCLWGRQRLPGLRTIKDQRSLRNVVHMKPVTIISSEDAMIECVSFDRC